MRASGILLPVSSLPSKYGIGTMGTAAREFIDFLKKGGQTYWQILPICPTSYGDSPYQSFSSFAGNPYFIDLELLCEENLLTMEECEALPWGEEEAYIDYGLIYQSRFQILKTAYIRFKQNIPQEFWDFCWNEGWWLEDYSLFMALKDANEGVAWNDWEEKYKYRHWDAILAAKEEYKEGMQFYKMLQFFFFKQWNALKKYANENGIKIIGDVPIYVAFDSADVWANPDEFYLDEKREPIDVAGCPPDAFSEEGQLWGNPLFRWDVMKNNGYDWWTKRISAMSRNYDIIRIDHFRGFDSYYAIPAKDTTAVNGQWRQGPGMDLFRVLEQKLGKLPIIVEDLGYLTDSVYKLLEDSGFPGMKVLQFAFDSREEESCYLPHTYTKHCVVYTGTHDNNTCIGWLQTAPKETVAYAKEYLNLSQEEGYHWGIIKAAWSSVADMAIIPMQDLLELGEEARLNAPSTLGSNWRWRATSEQMSETLAKKICKYAILYGRFKNRN